MSSAEQSGNPEASAVDMEQLALPAPPMGDPVIYGPPTHLQVPGEQAEVSPPNPFWSDRHQAEYELARARPKGLEFSDVRDNSTGHNTSAVDERADHQETPTDHVSQDVEARCMDESYSNSRSRSTSPGVKAILTQMKSLLEQVITSQQEHGTRLEKLEAAELHSACSAQSGSAGRSGGALVQQGSDRENNKLVGSGVQRSYPDSQGEVGRPVVTSQTLGQGGSQCQHFYIGSARHSREPEGLGRSGNGDRAVSNSRAPPPTYGEYDFRSCVCM